MDYYLFLDHDGVVRGPNQWKNYTIPLEWFDKQCVALLNKLHDLIPYKIVCIASDRKYSTLKELQEWYRENGVVAELVDCTIDLFASNPKSKRHGGDIRSEEVLTWIEENKEKILGYVVVDDDLLTVPNFVKTDPFEGLKAEGIFDEVYRVLQKNRDMVQSQSRA